MTNEERERFCAMERDIRGIKDDMHLLMTNHLVHLKDDIGNLKDDVEQTYGLANEAAKRAAHTEKFVAGAVAFFGLIMALIQCLG